MAWSGGSTSSWVFPYLELFEILLELGNELNSSCNPISETIIYKDFKEWFEKIADGELCKGNKKMEEKAARILQIYFPIE